MTDIIRRGQNYRFFLGIYGAVEIAPGALTANNALQLQVVVP
jgi:hypothetical protein